MVVAVTGAAGHVGANLTRTLLERGRRVRALIYHDTRALDGLDVERVHGDILDVSSLERALHGAEVVYHLAVRISVSGDRDRLMHRTNVVGTRNVVKACRSTGVRRLVHFSSIHALSHRPSDEVIDEGRKRAMSDKVPAYDRSKALSEGEVREGVSQGLDAVIINPTAILGPHDHKPSHMGQVLLNLYHRRLPALISGGFDWVDVRDVVEGALAAESVGKTGESYLLSGHWLSLRELAQLVAGVTSRNPPRLVSPAWLAYAGVPFAALYGKLTARRPLLTTESVQALQRHKRISHQKATAAFGYGPRPLKDTLADTFRWFGEAGMLS